MRLGAEPGGINQGQALIRAKAVHTGLTLASEILEQELDLNLDGRMDDQAAREAESLARGIAELAQTLAEG